MNDPREETDDRTVVSRQDRAGAPVRHRLQLLLLLDSHGNRREFCDEIHGSEAHDEAVDSGRPIRLIVSAVFETNAKLELAREEPNGELVEQLVEELRGTDQVRVGDVE